MSIETRTEREVPRLAGLREIADLTGNAVNTVRGWRKRYPDFPAPVQDLIMGPVWREADVMAFIHGRPNLGRSSKFGPETHNGIRAAVEGGNTDVSALAREFECSRGTVYNIAGDLLFT